MIQSNDLRLGNKVLWNDLICTVAGIQYFIDADENKEGHIVDLYNNGEMVQTPYVSYINPIPLTPEILEKCGFEKKYSHSNLSKYVGNGTLYWNDVMSLSYAFGHDYEEEPIEHTQYLHQLQNLYFALTGEELKINL